MTFDTWWKEQGSLHRNVFNMSFVTRDLFKEVAEYAWNAASRQDADYDLYVATQKRELARLNELKKQARKAQRKTTKKP